MQDCPFYDSLEGQDYLFDQPYVNLLGVIVFDLKFSI